jgi:hypothetical protein
LVTAWNAIRVSPGPFQFVWRYSELIRVNQCKLASLTRNVRSEPGQLLFAVVGSHSGNHIAPADFQYFVGWWVIDNCAPAIFVLGDLGHSWIVTDSFSRRGTHFAASAIKSASKIACRPLIAQVNVTQINVSSHCHEKADTRARIRQKQKMMR